MTTKKTENHLISRRETLRLMGAAGSGVIMRWGDKQAMDLRPPLEHGLVVEASSLPSVVRPALFHPIPMPRASRDASSLACVVRPTQTEGPYFVDERLNRSDIRIHRPVGTM
jgi:hypothetical protein